MRDSTIAVYDFFYLFVLLLVLFNICLSAGIIATTILSLLLLLQELSLHLLIAIISGQMYIND